MKHLLKKLINNYDFNIIKLDLASEVVTSNELELYRSIQQNIDLKVETKNETILTDSKWLEFIINQLFL